MEIAIKGYLAASHFLAESSSDWDGIFIIDSGFSIHPDIEHSTNRNLVLTFDDIEIRVRASFPFGIILMGNYNLTLQLRTQIGERIGWPLLNPELVE